MNSLCPAWSQNARAWIADFLLDDNMAYGDVLFNMGADAFSILSATKSNKIDTDDVLFELYIRHNRCCYGLDAYRFSVKIFSDVLGLQVDINISDVQDCIVYEEESEEYKKVKVFFDKISEKRKRYENAHDLYLNATRYYNQKEWSLAIECYEKSEKGFFSIRTYRDSDQYVKICRENIIFSKDKLKEKNYIEAIEFFNKAITIDDYVTVFNLFSKIEDFKDSKRKMYVCYQRIKNLKDKQKFDDIKKNIEEIDHLSDVNEKAKRYCQVITENESDDVSEEIRQIILECKEKLEITKNEIKYLAAIKALENANTEKEFSFAQKLFSDLKDYKDCREKSEFCRNKAIEAVNAQIYSEASELIKATDRINSFDILKSMFKRKKY